MPSAADTGADARWLRHVLADCATHSASSREPAILFIAPGQTCRGSDEEGVNVARTGITRGRTTRRAGLTALLALTAMLVSGCSSEEVIRFGWPEGVTPQADSMRQLWTWSCIAALVVGLMVWGLMFWTITFHKKKAGSAEFPRQTQYNLPFEVVYTVVPFLAIAVLFYFTVITQNKVTEIKANPDVSVDVTAFQWNWEFAYPQVKAPDGQPVSTIGSSSEVPVLVLPTGKRVQFSLTSLDVIHSFWVPEFLFKRDVFPYPDKNDTKKVFQISSIDREGAFVGRCAELCGTYHSTMNFEIRAVSPELYQGYLALRQKVNPTTNASYTTAEALGELGKVNPNCGTLCSPVSTSTIPFNTKRDARQATVAGGN
jgi:cytochrome c oxidase subunit 2